MKKIGFIEIINDLGYNVVFIDNTYYVYTEFIIPDDVVTEISLIGKNITDIIEHQPDTFGLDKLRQRELIDKISVMKSRRRQFHKDVIYVKYLANG